MLYKHLICLTLCSLWRPIIISGKIPEVGWGGGVVVVGLKKITCAVLLPQEETDLH